MTASTNADYIGRGDHDLCILVVSGLVVVVWFFGALLWEKARGRR